MFLVCGFFVAMLCSGKCDPIYACNLQAFVCLLCPIFFHRYRKTTVILSPPFSAPHLHKMRELHQNCRPSPQMILSACFSLLSPPSHMKNRISPPKALLAQPIDTAREVAKALGLRSRTHRCLRVPHRVPHRVLRGRRWRERRKSPEKRGV